MRWKSGVGAIAGLLLAACGGGAVAPIPKPTPPAVLARQISRDPFSDAAGQHATEVEPSAFANGATIVAAFQQGRQFVAGGSGIGFATSFDGGATWTAGSLPGLTRAAGGTFDSASDASVAYDAAHRTWLIATLPLSSNISPYLAVSRSLDGLHWDSPVPVSPGESPADKGWIVCDNHVASSFYGHCYVEWDDVGSGGTIRLSTSTDGGAIWSASTSTADAASGIGGQPLVQPNGTVVVPIDDYNEATVLAFDSRDGGTTWSATTPVTPIIDHAVAGHLRAGPLVSAAIDASGVVYVVWQDCRFRAGCAENDLVLSTSSEGVTWSAPARIPIDDTNSTVDHFIPGLGVDPATAGTSAHLGLTYYFYPKSACAASCQLYAGFIGSPDGGRSWRTPSVVDTPAMTSWLANTDQGRMAADYVATTFSAGMPIGVFADADANAGATFDEAIFATRPGVLTVTQGAVRTSRGERAIPNAKPDHPPRRFRPP